MIDQSKMEKCAKIITKMRLSLVTPLNASQFARKLGVTSASLSHWERGLRFPHMDNIVKLEKFAKKHNLPFNREDFF